jgi:hypothetical protein
MKRRGRMAIRLFIKADLSKVIVAEFRESRRTHGHEWRWGWSAMS